MWKTKKIPFPRSDAITLKTPCASHVAQSPTTTSESTRCLPRHCSRADHLERTSGLCSYLVTPTEPVCNCVTPNCVCHLFLGFHHLRVDHPVVVNRLVEVVVEVDCMKKILMMISIAREYTWYNR